MITTKRTNRCDRINHDGSLVIYFRGTTKPYCRFKPGYNPEIGPYVALYRFVFTDGEQEEHLLTIGLDAVTSILTRLPLVVAAARRLQSRASRPVDKAQRL